MQERTVEFSFINIASKVKMGGARYLHAGAIIIQGILN